MDGPTLTTDLGLSIRVSMFEHVDWWLGPLPRSPGMGEGGDWWSWPMGVIAEGIPRGCQGLFTPVSLGYPLSVFNKNSTLKGIYPKVLGWQRPEKEGLGQFLRDELGLPHHRPYNWLISLVIKLDIHHPSKKESASLTGRPWTSKDIRLSTTPSHNQTLIAHQVSTTSTTSQAQTDHWPVSRCVVFQGMTLSGVSKKSDFPHLQGSGLACQAHFFEAHQI